MSCWLRSKPISAFIGQSLWRESGRWTRPVEGALWVSTDGSPMTQMAIYDRIRAQTKQQFRGRAQSASLSRRRGNDTGDRRSGACPARRAASRPSDLHDDREILPTGARARSSPRLCRRHSWRGCEINERLPFARRRKRSTSLFATRNSTICRLTNYAWSSTTWTKT